MDKTILMKFLKCGYVEKGVFYPTTCGVPQGGPLSTVLCNMALDGLQGMLNDRFNTEVQFVRYADDYILIAEVNILYCYEDGATGRDSQNQNRQTSNRISENRVVSV